MKSLKNNKTILAVIPVTVVLAAGIAFFCSHSGNSSSQCSQNVERLKELETADISAIEEQVRSLSEKDKPANREPSTEEGVLGEVLTDVQIKQAFQGSVIVGDSTRNPLQNMDFLTPVLLLPSLDFVLMTLMNKSILPST